MRHKARGRISNNRIDFGVRDYAVALVRERCADFGPTLAAEKLAEPDALRVSGETLRKCPLSTLLRKALPGNGWSPGRQVEGDNLRGCNNLRGLAQDVFCMNVALQMFGIIRYPSAYPAPRTVLIGSSTPVALRNALRRRPT